MIYFDNAATTFKKPLCVKLGVLKALCNYSANPGRSGHRHSLKAARQIFKTRLTIKNLFNCESESNVIFTQNCTDALNLAILGSARDGGHVITSCFEHNSVLRPLNYLKSIGKITLSIVQPSNGFNITLDDIKNAYQDNTYLVCLTHISNVTGNRNDIEGVGRFCKEHNLVFLVDAAQSCGHVDIDMQKSNINLLAFAGHKGLFAPSSIGGLCINKTNINPIRFGGTGTNSVQLTQPDSLPERLEAGTLSTPLIMGLLYGTKFVIRNFDRHKKKVAYLTKYLIDNLTKINATIYTQQNSKYGVVCFNLKNVDSIEASGVLDEKYNIAVRGGLHCAPLCHKFLGTIITGAIRISLNHYNSKRQINKLIKALTDISQGL